jgi:DNA polymerase-4
VETISLWEAYIDVTPAARHGTSTPEEISRRIKYAIHTEVGLIASIGAASSKLVAKVAGESRGPDALVLVPPDSEAEFMAPLPISALPNLGPRTEERLRQLGIRTMGDLGGFDTQRLVTAVGPNGAILQRLALGRDRSPVMGLQPAKTISAEVTFDQDVRDRPQLEQAMGELTRRLAGRLQADGVRARTVYVKLKLPDQSLVSRQVSRTSPTDDADVIFRAGLAALERSHLTGQAVRLMGVGLAGLIHPVSDLQMNLFD